MIRRRRLLLEDVERGAGDLPGRDRLGERRLVDDAAARAVDDAHAALHARDGLARRSSPRVSAVSGVWMVMKSARGKSCVERHQLDAQPRRGLRR